MFSNSLCVSAFKHFCLIGLNAFNVYFPATNTHTHTSHHTISTQIKRISNEIFFIWEYFVDCRSRIRNWCTKSQRNKKKERKKSSTVSNENFYLLSYKCLCLRTLWICIYLLLLLLFHYGVWDMSRHYRHHH